MEQIFFGEVHDALFTVNYSATHTKSHLINQYHHLMKTPAVGG